MLLPQNKIAQLPFRVALKNDKSLRVILKTISWRIIGTIDTVIISWILSGTFAIAISIGSIEVVTKMVLYFFHERLWNKL